MKIGIGITTRNRTEVLEQCMRHFTYFSNSDCKIVVVDDSKKNSHQARCNETLVLYHHFNYIKPLSERRGIAKAKNACLSALKDCDHIFLFDDDCFPRCKDWASLWINAGFDHLAYSVDISPMGGHLRPTGNAVGAIQEYTGVLGCMLYLSKNALKQVGWFDPKFGLYGYEHAQFTKRCHLAKLSPFMYSIPDFARKTIYSLDMDYGWFKEKMPNEYKFDYDKFGSSVTKEEAATHEQFAHLMNTKEIYIPEPQQ